MALTKFLKYTDAMFPQNGKFSLAYKIYSTHVPIFPQLTPIRNYTIQTIWPSATGVEQIINAKEIRGGVRAGSLEEVRLEFGHWRMGTI